MQGMHERTPVGELCWFCEVRIKEEDRGLLTPDPCHLSCFMAAIGVHVIHVLEAGKPMCGFSLVEPGRWPHGNIWVSRLHPDVTQLVTCHRCKKALQI